MKSRGVIFRRNDYTDSILGLPPGAADCTSVSGVDSQTVRNCKKVPVITRLVGLLVVVPAFLFMVPFYCFLLWLYTCLCGLCGQDVECFLLLFVRMVLELCQGTSYTGLRV